MNKLSLLTTNVYAAGNKLQVVPNTEDASIGSLIAGALNYLMFFVGVAAVIGIVYGGVIMLTSAGNPDKLQTAKRAIMWSVLGVIVVVLAFTIVSSIDKIISG